MHPLLVQTRCCCRPFPSLGNSPEVGNMTPAAEPQRWLPLWRSWQRVGLIIPRSPVRSWSGAYFLLPNARVHHAGAKRKKKKMPEVGFEPTRTIRPADLKSAPLDLSGIQASIRSGLLLLSGLAPARPSRVLYGGGAKKCLTGFEPATPRFEVWCAVHCATST